MISVAGKLRITPCDIYAAVANNDVDKAPLLTVGQAQIAIFGGIGSALAILLATYTSVQVMSSQLAEFRGRDAKEKEQITSRLDKLEDVDVRTIERLIRLETTQSKR